MTPLRAGCGQGWSETLGAGRKKAGVVGGAVRRRYPLQERNPAWPYYVGRKRLGMAGSGIYAAATVKNVNYVRVLLFQNLRIYSVTKNREFID